LVIEHHYKHKRCPIIRAWGIEQSGEIVGVLTIGLPVTFSARCDVVGENKNQRLLRTSRQHDVYELNRLWVSDTLPRNTESQFIGWCLRQIQKIHPHMILISYADGSRTNATGLAHVGFVYQATNWLYLGSSIGFDDIAVVGGNDYRSVAEKIRGGVYFNVPPTACLRDLFRKNPKRAVKPFPPSPHPWRAPSAGPRQQKHAAGRGRMCENRTEFSRGGVQKNLGLISRATESDMKWSYDPGLSNTGIYGLQARRTEKFSPNPHFLTLKRRLNDSATKRRSRTSQKRNRSSLDRVSTSRASPSAVWSGVL